MAIASAREAEKIFRFVLGGPTQRRLVKEHCLGNPVDEEESVQVTEANVKATCKLLMSRLGATQVSQLCSSLARVYCILVAECCPSVATAEIVGYIMAFLKQTASSQQLFPSSHTYASHDEWTSEWESNLDDLVHFGIIECRKQVTHFFNAEALLEDANEELRLDRERRRIASRQLERLLKSLSPTLVLPPIDHAEICHVCEQGTFIRIKHTAVRAADEALRVDYFCINPIHANQIVTWSR